MPRILPNRPLNTKIIYSENNRNRFLVFNTHNSGMKSFTSMERLFSYHSPNTIFIDFTSSHIVDKHLSRLRNNIQLTNDIVLHRMFSATAQGGHRYYNIQHTTSVGNELVDDYSNYVVLNDQFCSSRINEIRNRINTISRNVHFAPIDNEEHDATTQQSITMQEIRNAVEQVNWSPFRTEEVSRPIEEEINTNLIYGYHSGPHEINMRNLADEDRSQKRYFGIELEMDASRDRDASSRKRNLLATRLHNILNEGNYNQLVKFENDGSLGQYGIEMITQPMTMRFIMANKEKFGQALRMIDELNFSSHDSGCCGMHIHVSREALTRDTIDNLYLMFENFKNEIIAFSRRNEQGMRWCRFITDSSYSPNTMDDDYIKRNKPNGNDHHSAINNGNRNTVEFRIFRGTTKLKTFLANIQLIDNMIDIASKSDITGITWDNIIDYNSDYTELISYNEKKGIVSKHKLTKTISKLEVTQRPVILVRPFQLTMEGDR